MVLPLLIIWAVILIVLWIVVKKIVTILFYALIIWIIYKIGKRQKWWKKVLG